MLQTFAAQNAGAFEDRERSLDPWHVVAIFRRRIFYFAIPFVVLLILGCLIVAIQRPLFQSEGKILVESPEIPTNLVEPTVTAAATERIQVIQQRIMTRDNLLSIVKKFDLFPSQQQWMSSTQLLDLMRQRAQIKLVDIDSSLPGVERYGPNNSAIAFTITFEYETGDLAMKVANELLTMILDEDVRTRTGRATETTEFLAQEVQRLQSKLDGIDAQIAQLKRQASGPAAQGGAEATEELKAQTDALAAMKDDLVQKSSVYSDEHPVIKALKKRIAMLERQVAQEQKASDVVPHQQGQGMDVLVQQQASTEKELDDASKKLTAARLGQSMEQNQQAEHLEVLEQPTLPQQPIKPKRMKLLAVSFALAAAAGLGTVMLAEMLDKSIRGSRELLTVLDGQLLVPIPYILTPGELVYNRRRVLMLWAALGVFLMVGVAVVLYIGVEVNFSWFDRSWIDSLTRLSK